MDNKLRKYIRVQAIASFVINGIINGLIIFFLTWGKGEYAVGYAGVLITFAIDNFITCPLLGLFGADGAVKNLKKEKTLFSLPPAGTRLARISKWMQKPKRHGLLLGFVAFVIVFGLSAAGVFLFRAETLTRWGYVIYKALYTGALGAGFSVLFLNAALRKPEGTMEGPA
jgi:hypothetical protein